MSWQQMCGGGFYLFFFAARRIIKLQMKAECQNHPFSFALRGPSSVGFRKLSLPANAQLHSQIIVRRSYALQ